MREMLIQHILTEEVFVSVVPGTPFHNDNNVARELYKLEATFFTGNTKFRTLKALDPPRRRDPLSRRADRHTPREANVPESHLRELLQGL